MAKFAGSQFFSDTKYLQHQVFCSREYELPMFINGKFLKINPNPEWRRQLRRHVGRYKFYYKYRKQHRFQPVAVPVESCRDKSVFNARFPERKSMGLPPNRFNITGHNLANIIGRSTGNKGPYACFTGERNDESITGKLAPSKFKGSATMFYDMPSTMDRLSHPRLYFKMKIRHGSRFEQTPYSRFMLNDLTLCPRDPSQPGPCDCQPDFTLLSKHYVWRPHKEPLVFFPGSCVPQNDRFWLRRPFVPGPGRYSPEPGACPCARGSSYIAERERLLQLAKRRHTENIPVKLNMKKCSSPYTRNIRGRGHTFVFKSVVVRLIPTPVKADRRHATLGSKELQMEHDVQYIKMIMNPKRETISYPVFDLNEIQMRPGKLRFNSIERPTIRTKMRQNRRVAFMSCCPRWPVSALVPVARAGSKKKKVKHISPNIKSDLSLHWLTDAKSPMERLAAMPERYSSRMPVVDRSNKMRYTFEPLPPARILLQDKLTIDKEQLTKINTPLDPEKFYKAEVLALRLPKKSIERTLTASYIDEGSVS